MEEGERKEGREKEKMGGGGQRKEKGGDGRRKGRESI